MALANLSNNSIIKVTTVGGSTAAIAVTGGTEQPFPKVFKNQPSFYAEHDGTNHQVTIASGATVKINYWDLQDFDTLSSVPTGGSGFFKAPHFGIYQFNIQIMFSSMALTGNDRIDMYVYRTNNSGVGNATGYIHHELFQGQSGWNGTSGASIFPTIRTSFTYQLGEDDLIEVRVKNSTGVPITTYGGSAYTKWSGGLMK